MSPIDGPGKPKVAILLCTHNGESFLQEQLDSYLQQTWTNWSLIASDDQSSDRTRAILAACQQQWSPDRVQLLTGPARGFAENFMAVTRHAQGQADFYAWSDQDDIWCPAKLERALQWLQTVPRHIPAIYCSRTILVGPDNQDLGMSQLFSREPSFANALTQSIGGGNTMVFNQAACQLLAETSMDTAVVAHDWWAYIIITGCGGQVHYDPVPTVRYRQHQDNLIGENTSWSARSARLRQIFNGRYRELNALNIQALYQHQHRLTGESINTLRLFAETRDGSLPTRLVQLKRSGVHRQTLIDNLGLVLATALRKV